MEACEVYTRQFSTLVTWDDLATLGATLANNGTNPISGKQVIQPENIKPILAEMTVEGLKNSYTSFPATGLFWWACQARAA